MARSLSGKIRFRIVEHRAGSKEQNTNLAGQRSGLGKTTVISRIHLPREIGGRFVAKSRNEGDRLFDRSSRIIPIEAGVSVIYQERQILLELSVAENIYLGRMPTRAGLIDTRRANTMAQRIIDDFGLPIKATTKVKDLSIAYQQMVEIMKAYSRENLKVICFDEPTASLSDAEIDSLFAIIRKLKAEGKVIIYVSHRMSEIRTIADKVAIFKDGRYIDTVDAKTTPESQWIHMMVGRDLGDIYAELDRNKTIGEELLRVENLSSDLVEEVSFTLHKGEVLGFSGLVGAGRTEVMRAIIGADKMTGGEVYLEGKKLRLHSPHEAMKHGIVLVPEDRNELHPIC